MLQLLFESFEIHPDYIAEFILLLYPFLVLLATLSKVFLQRLLVGDPIGLESLLRFLHILSNLIYFYFSQGIS